MVWNGKSSHADIQQEMGLPCRIIHTYSPELHADIKFGDKSQGGRGGMTAKMDAAWRAAEQGCTTVIANGKMTNSILHVCPSLFPLQDGQPDQTCLASEALVMLTLKLLMRIMGPHRLEGPAAELYRRF